MAAYALAPKAQLCSSAAPRELCDINPSAESAIQLCADCDFQVAQLNQTRIALVHSSTFKGFAATSSEKRRVVVVIVARQRSRSAATSGLDFYRGEPAVSAP